MIALKNILVATDFSESAEAALRYGVELASKYDATLHVLHVVDDLAARPGPALGLPAAVGGLQTALEDNARTNLAELLLNERHPGLRAYLHVMVSTSPARAVLAYARDSEVDLIIVGTHGRHGLQHFIMGSIAQQVVRLAECPVLTVRAHERDFVVPDVSVSVENTQIT